MAVRLLIGTLGLLLAIYAGYRIGLAMRAMGRRSQALVIAAQWLSLILIAAALMQLELNSPPRVALSYLWLLVCCASLLPVVVFFGRPQPRA